MAFSEAILDMMQYGGNITRHAKIITYQLWTLNIDRKIIYTNKCKHISI